MCGHVQCGGFTFDPEDAFRLVSRVIMAVIPFSQLHQIENYSRFKEDVFQCLRRRWFNVQLEGGSMFKNDVVHCSMRWCQRVLASWWLVQG